MAKKSSGSKSRTAAHAALLTLLTIKRSEQAGGASFNHLRLSEASIRRLLNCTSVKPSMRRAWKAALLAAGWKAITMPDHHGCMLFRLDSVNVLPLLTLDGVKDTIKQVRQDPSLWGAVESEVFGIISLNEPSQPRKPKSA